MTAEETVITAKETTIEQTVTPWEVSAADESGVDYAKLTEKFGCEVCDEALLARFEQVIKQPLHPLLRRGIFFAHRELQVIINAKERNIPIYLYTGRGPSSEALHVGHLVPLIMLKWLQEVLDCPVVIQLTDDEKFLFKENLTLEETHRLGAENARDIIAVGFKPEKTFIFRNLDYMGVLYPTALELMKRTTFNQVKGIFGFGESTNIGSVAFPAMQAAPAFARAFPKLFGSETSEMLCLVPYAIDQDPYFRMCRDLAPRMHLPKPCALISRFIPALQGAMTKMSGSGEQTAIFVTDTAKQVKTKVNKYAFSGGRDTAEEQRRLGARLDVDVAYQYLRVFMHDDAELERIGREYESGQLLTGEVKAILIKVLNEIIAEHQTRRSRVTTEVLEQFFAQDRPQLRLEIEAACKAARERKVAEAKEAKALKKQATKEVAANPNQSSAI